MAAVAIKIWSGKECEGSMITGEQIRRARCLARLTQKQLARAANVRFEAVDRAERSIGEVPLTIARAEAIRTALEAAGVEFHGDGVRLRTTAEPLSRPLAGGG